MDTLLAVAVWMFSGPLADPSVQLGTTYLKLWTALPVFPKIQGLMHKNQSEA